MNRKILACNVIGLMLLVCPVRIGAQNSAITGSSLNMAYGVSTGANTAVQSSAGEVSVGTSEGENTRTESCFLVVLRQRQAILAVEETTGLPAEFALHQNYPNPFNPSTTIQFDLPKATDIHIVVYDLLGREVVWLVEQRLEAGYHQLVWNGRDRSGREMPTGMYIVQMLVPPTAGATPEYRKSVKLLLLK